MRKNLLALSIAAMVGGLSGVANAQVQNTTGGAFDLISFNPQTDGALLAGGGAGAGAGTRNLPAATALVQAKNGIGHILVVPYFSAQNGNMSLLNITNTDEVNAKAVKLRYRGAANSDDVFDITVYLSPGDVWTANVAKNEAGYSYLETTDNSCTLPSKEDIKSAEMKNGQFKTGRLDGGVLNPQPQGTLEGYIEILNTADIPPAFNNGRTLYERIKHSAGKAACGLNDQFTPLNATTSTPAARGYGAPSGGLMADWMIVNATGKATYSGQAIALRASVMATNAVGQQFWPNALGQLVWAPQTTDNVPPASALLLTADPLLTSGLDTAPRPASYDFPDLSTPYTVGSLGTPAAQVAQLANGFATYSVANEYSAAGAFNTDWVFTMPTRRYVVAVDYEANSVVPKFGDQLNPANKAFGTDTHFRYALGGNVFYDKSKKRICVDAGKMVAYDREETVRNEFVISPDTSFRFCGEADVLSFNVTESKVLGAKIAAQTVQTKMNDGWFRIETNGLGNGLPVVGFAAIKMDGVNLGGAWPHRMDLQQGN